MNKSVNKLATAIIFKLFAILLFSAVIFSACKEEEPEVAIDIDALQLEVSDSAEKNPFDLQQVKWRKTNKRICIIFGYDFNSPEVIEKITGILSENFGLEEDDGLIYTITYPTDFKHPKTYISELTSMLTETDKDLLGVIILGAPEKTHYALGRIQDYWNMEIPYPIFSLFPQDEPLGLESTCDFVLDKFLAADITGDVVSDENVAKIVEESPAVLISTINYMKNLNGGLKKNSTLQTHIVQMLRGNKLQYYTDPETGLHAINHFIIY